MTSDPSHRFDILIIGSGAAGLTLALRAAAFARVGLLSKSSLEQGATFYAQGGIAAVLDDRDSLESHVADTIAVGGGLCHRDMVEHVVGNSAAAVEWLVRQGVPFSIRPGANIRRGSGDDAAVDLSSLHLAQEGAHSHRRIIHATDATGKAVFQTLRRRASENPAIHLMEGRTALDLVVREPGGGAPRRCAGVYVLDDATRRVAAIEARFVVLATGGASKAYLYTTNPDSASGDGIAMAWRAGCRVANMEFNQFHPTCLFHPHARSFLITEAMRGEGARLELADGTRFMERFDRRGELASRDVVARAIDHETKRLGEDCVFLNISRRPAKLVRERFPNIYRRCMELGVDITRDRIPVVPAAHYTCGGVMINRDGETDIENLYAVGETTFSGLHGANRIASNSLSECFVIAFSAADSIRRKIADTDFFGSAPGWPDSRAESGDDILISHNWDELRRCMWDYVGIVRSDSRLRRAARRLQMLREEIHDHFRRYRISRDMLELRNLALVADLIVRSAGARKESRGLHFNQDHPGLLPQAADTVLTPPEHADPAQGDQGSSGQVRASAAHGCAAGFNGASH